MSDTGRIDGELIQRLLSQRVTGYKPLSGFAANTVAAVTLESGARAVFKAAGKREVEVELWALRSMPERGIPVPEVIAGDPEAEIPYLVTRLVSGEPGVATLQAASEVGRLLCAVHAMPVGRDCGAAGPWLDLARLDFREPGLQRAMLDAYFPAGVPTDAPSHLANHRLLYMLLALVFEFECGGDWLHERVPGIESALTTL